MPLTGGGLSRVAGDKERNKNKQKQHLVGGQEPSYTLDPPPLASTNTSRGPAGVE